MRDGPGFWYHPTGGVAAFALTPLALLYAAGWRLRDALATAYVAPVPLVCIGNPTLGGAGKTPTAIAVAGRLIRLGATPHFLSKGYGGSLRGPITVDPSRHTAAEVGDEPLLLARTAPTHVARSRAGGAAFAAAAGAGTIVMDDGFQNPTIARDLAILVVDGGVGAGNGQVFPAGPLRAPLGIQIARADAVLVIGDGAPGTRIAEAAVRADRPVIRGALAPADGGALAGRRVVAFAGIGRPGKFHESLEAAGAVLIARQDYPDHHPYSVSDVAFLTALAARHGGADLVTTEKDLVRFDETNDPGGHFRARIRTLPVRLEVEDAGALDRLLAGLATGRKGATRAC